MNGFVGRWLKLSIVALVGCGFVGLMVYALLMKDQILSAQVEPPLIAAPEDPAKRRPEEPGGMEIPNQDKLVFDLLEHPSPTDLTSSQPLAGVDPSPEAGAETPQSSTATTPVTASNAAPVEEVVVAAPSPIVAAKEIEPAAAPVAQVVEKPAPVAQTKSEPLKQEAVKEQPKTEAAAARGGWGVQLAAVGSEADAKKAIEGFSKIAALKSLTSKVSKVDLGAKGVRYRVQYVGLVDRNAATGLCGKLGKKQACMPVAIK